MPAQELFREKKWEIRNKILLARARHEVDMLITIARHVNNEI